MCYIKISMIVNIIIFIIVLIIIIYIITNVSQMQAMKDIKQTDAEINSLDLIDRKKENCKETNQTCFDNADCVSKCTVTGGKCVYGICKIPEDLESEVSVNECDAKKGTYPFLVGDRQFGRYTFVCKSIDPGIASNNPKEANKMCENGQIDIDYLKYLPTTDHCGCSGNDYLIEIPQTLNTRKIAYCTSSLQEYKWINNLN